MEKKVLDTYAKNHEFVTSYANYYADNLLRKTAVDEQMADKWCDFLSDVTVDQLYDACLFVNEKEAACRFGGVKEMPQPNANLAETYHILMKHFYVNLRDRLYHCDSVQGKDFFAARMNEQQNVFRSIQDLQKTYTECYGWQTDDAVSNEQRNLQRELSTYQGKAMLLQSIMKIAPKTTEQDQGLAR